MVSLQMFVAATDRQLTFDPSAAESEEALLKMAVAQPESSAAVLPDFSSMTEEEQIAYAMQMSLAGGGELWLGRSAPPDQKHLLMWLRTCVLTGESQYLVAQSFALIC